MMDGYLGGLGVHPTTPSFGRQALSHSGPKVEGWSWEFTVEGLVCGAV